MDKFIFLIEKVTNDGVGFALSTAPFFIDNDNNNTIILRQIRDANFSYVVDHNEKIYMRLYRLSKAHAMNYHKCTEQQVFNQVIRKLISYYPKQIMDFVDIYHIKLIKELSYKVGQENLSDIVFKKTSVDDIPSAYKNSVPTNKIYLYNPSIILQKNETFS